MLLTPFVPFAVDERKRCAAEILSLFQVRVSRQDERFHAKVGIFQQPFRNLVRRTYDQNGTPERTTDNPVQRLGPTTNCCFSDNSRSSFCLR